MNKSHIISVLCYICSVLLRSWKVFVNSPRRNEMCLGRRALNRLGGGWFHKSQRSEFSLCLKFFLINSWREIEVKWSHSVVSDSLQPMDCRPPSSSVHGLLQARILEWIAISFSRGSSQPRDQTQVSHIAGRRFNLCTYNLNLFLRKNDYWNQQLIDVTSIILHHYQLPSLHPSFVFILPLYFQVAWFAVSATKLCIHSFTFSKWQRICACAYKKM